MDLRIKELLDSSSEEELINILEFLQFERFAQIISDECIKYGSTSLTDENIKHIISEVSNDSIFKYAKENTYSLVEWLQYWFGETSPSSTLEATGVFFEEGDKFLDSLKQYLDNYKNIVSTSENRKEDIVQFLENVDNVQTDPKARKNIQEFFDKYTASYSLDERGNLVSITKDNTEEFALQDPYNIGLKEFSAKNKQLYENYNESLEKDVSDLFSNIINSINNRLLELETLISSDTMYETIKAVKQSGMSGTGKGITSSASAFGGRPIIVGLKYLVEDAQNMAQLYINYEDIDEDLIKKQRENLIELEKESPELIKKKKNLLQELDSTLKKIESKKENYTIVYNMIDVERKNNYIQYNTAMEAILWYENTYTNALFGSGGAATEQQQPKITQDQYLTYKSYIADYNKALKIVEEYENLWSNIKDTQANLSYCDSEISENTNDIESIKAFLKNQKTFEFYKEKYNKYIKLLGKAEIELDKYINIFEVLTGKDVDSFTGEKELEKLISDRLAQLSPNEIRQLVSAVNGLLPKRIAVDLPPELKEEQFTPTYEEGVPSEELTPTEDLNILATTFVKALDSYDRENESIEESKKEIYSVLEQTFSSLSSEYKSIKESINDSLNSLKESMLKSPEFDIESKAVELQDISNVYSERLEAVKIFRERLKKTNDFDASTIYNYLTKKYKGDTSLRKMGQDVAVSLDRLSKYISTIGLPENETILAELDNYGISSELLENAFENIKTVAEPTNDDLLGTNSLIELVTKLKAIDPKAYKTLVPTGINIQDFGKDLIYPLQECLDKLNRNGQKKLEAFKDTSSIIANSVNDIITEDVIDIDRLNEMFSDAAASAVFEGLLSNDKIKEYRKNVSRSSIIRDAKIKENISKGIQKQLKELTKKINASLKTMNSTGRVLNTKLFGDEGALLNLRSNVLRLQESIPKLESEIQNIKEMIASPEEYRFTKNELGEWLKQLEATLATHQKRLPIAQKNLQVAEESIKKPKESEKFVDKVLFPQKTMAIKTIGDPFDPTYGDWLDNRTTEDVLSGVGSYKHRKESPSSVKESHRNWYSTIRLWKNIINQCSSSIRGAMRSIKDNQSDIMGDISEEVNKTKKYTYSAKENQFSPLKKNDPGGSISQEIAYLSKKLKSDPSVSTQIDRLQNIQKKISLKPKEIVELALPPLKTSSDTEAKQKVRTLASIKRKLDENAPLSDLDKKFLNEVKYTPAELRLIGKLNEKWSSALIGKKYQKLKEYENILLSGIDSLKAEEFELKKQSINLEGQDPNFQKNSNYLKISIKRKEIQDKIKWLNFPLFKIRYAPESLSNEELNDINEILKGIEKETAKRFEKEKIEKPSFDRK